MAAKGKKEEILIVNRRTGKALQASGSENGAVVVQSAITGEEAQLWSTVKSGKQIKLVNKASGKVLDVVHGATESGAWAHIWEDVGGASQLWQWVKVTATYKKLMNVQSGKVLDIVDMSEDDGAPTQIWDDVDGAGQQWKTASLETAVSRKSGPKPKEETQVTPASEAHKEEPEPEPVIVAEEPTEEVKTRTARKTAAAKRTSSRKRAAKEETAAPAAAEGEGAPVPVPSEEKPPRKKTGRRAKPKAEQK